jgi:protein SCO1/2
MTRVTLLAFCLAVALPSCRTKQPLMTYNAVPEFTLTDQNGDAFASQARLDGKVWVADFIFTTCTGPCPRMTSQMKQVQGKLDGLPDVKLVSFTVDPDNDTPPALDAYARRFGAQPDRWHFLTGPKDTLHSLNREAFMLGNVDGSLDHSTRFILIDKQSRVRKYYHTNEGDFVPELLADIRTLLSE